MRKKMYLLSVLLLVISIMPVLAKTSSKTRNETNDTIGRQILYNGRAWKNIYYRVKGDQFLFSSGFLPGSVTISGRKFGNLFLKYDIYNDELILLNDRNITIQLNKEMIERFTMEYRGGLNSFKKLEADSINSLPGYVNILYEGNTSLYVKYTKEILMLAVDNKYDLFNQINKIYLEKDGIIEQVNNKRRLLNLIADQKEEVRQYIKRNRIRLSRKNPEGYVPVIEHYNKITD